MGKGLIIPDLVSQKTASQEIRMLKGVIIPDPVPQKTDSQEVRMLKGVVIPDPVPQKDPEPVPEASGRRLNTDKVTKEAWIYGSEGLPQEIACNRTNFTTSES